MGNRWCGAVKRRQMKTNTVNLWRIISLLLVANAFTPLVAQQTNSGKSPEEQHAWRLYQDFKKSRETVQFLERAIKQGNADMRDVSYGFFGGFFVDPQDIESVKKARIRVNQEIERQQKLEAAWDRQFYYLNGSLADGINKLRWDPKEKRDMDLIESGLRNTPFRLATPQSSSPRIAGSWEGSWTNSLGEHGGDSLVLEESNDRKIAGTWSGNIPVSGGWINITTFKLHAQTQQRDYAITGTIQDDNLTLRYVATRLDSDGSYRGTSRFTREKTGKTYGIIQK